MIRTYPLDRKHRLFTMLLDHIIMGFALTILFAPVMIYHIFMIITTRPTIMPDPFADALLYQVFIYSLYFNKDIWLGQSIGKRLLKFRVLNVRTNRPAGPLRCLVRNFTLLIWPMEAVAAMINVERRIGDYIAGTKLALDSPEWEERPDWAWIVGTVLVGMGFVYVSCFYPMEQLYHWFIEQVKNNP